MAEVMIAAEEKIFACYDVPAAHRHQVVSTNPLERLNKDRKRRSAIIGFSPTVEHSSVC
jgi:putative transposase